MQFADAQDDLQFLQFDRELRVGDHEPTPLLLLPVAQPATAKPFSHELAKPLLTEEARECLPQDRCRYHRCVLSIFPQHGIHCEAPAHMRTRRPQVSQQFGLGAASLFQGVGQDCQAGLLQLTAGQDSLLGDLRPQPANQPSVPRKADWFNACRWAKRVVENVLEELAEGQVVPAAIGTGESWFLP
jgi:hypothetical protein